MKHGFTITEVMIVIAIVIAIIGILASIVVVPGFLTFKCHMYAHSLGIFSKNAEILCDEYSSNSNMEYIIAEVAKGKLSVEDALSISDDDYTPQDVSVRELENSSDEDNTRIQTLNNKTRLLEKQLDECMNNNVKIDECDRTWTD